MNTFITQKYSEAMKRFPPYVKEVFDNSGWEKKIVEIGRKNGIHVDDIVIFTNELMLLLANLVTHSEFRDTLREHANAKEEQIEKMIQDVNDEILAPIQQELRRKTEQEQARLMTDEVNETLQDHGVSFEADTSRIEKTTSAVAQVQPKQDMAFEQNMNKPFSFIQKPATPEISNTINQQNTTKVDPYREPIG